MKAETLKTKSFLFCIRAGKSSSVFGAFSANSSKETQPKAWLLTVMSRDIVELTLAGHGQLQATMVIAKMQFQKGNVLEFEDDNHRVLNTKCGMFLTQSCD